MADDVIAEMQRRLDAASRFPDLNPNPVLRMDDAGRLIYANAASLPIVNELRLELGRALPDALLVRLRAALATSEGDAIEVRAGPRSYSLKPVAYPEWAFVNIYGTDVTAARAVERFPDSNPNQVLRIDDAGRLAYANAASAPIVAALGLVRGEPIPQGLWDRLCASTPGSPGDPAVGRPGEPATGSTGEPLEVQGDAHWYELVCVPIPEFGFSNVYGRDITAMKAIHRFPGQNPNPVMRISREGRLLFANPASEPIVTGFALELGDPVPPALLDPIRAEIETGQYNFEVEALGRTFRMVAVAAFEFDFINLYATDITAARQVEEAHRENERLLLNILPAPIAQRLKAGEKVIADRHEDLSLLFADIVGFTAMSSRLTATEVVDLLDGLFRNVDELVDEYRLEKVKTIGDAYMVVGGLPPETDDHLARIAAMALDLNAILAGRSGDHPVRMRMGLHAGPAVAGVIGARKFIYDVWGGTVNTASRLEAFGLPDEIQVTEAVQARLEDRFVFEPRGIVDLKGLGPTRTWLLRGRKGRTSAAIPAVRLS